MPRLTLPVRIRRVPAISRGFGGNLLVQDAARQWTTCQDRSREVTVMPVDDEDPDDLVAAWSDVVRTARRTVDDGLVVGTSGNVSVRVGDDLVLVTPSGVPYHQLGPKDTVGVDLDGEQVIGELRPTSELAMHLAVYRNTDARAVVHTHAVHATAVSTLLYELPAIHYMAAALGGKIRVADYATYGTDELAENMLKALRDRTGCLLRNHGTIVYGDDLDQAYDRTGQLEWMCQVWLAARSVAGFTPSLLSKQELARVAEKLRGYGQQTQ
jgi:L-fuculose-phosphate aldolase